MSAMDYDICIQVHQSLNADVLEALDRLAQSHELKFEASEYDAKDEFLNLFFKGQQFDNVRMFWNELQAQVEEGNSPLSILKPYWIVVLVLDQNWDRYILLAHADENQQGQIDPCPQDDNWDAYWAQYDQRHDADFEDSGTS
ncbi:hypothetical protein [Saezia sanguinis]|nr:hypothetical protein [Saezia sanguinis]